MPSFLGCFFGVSFRTERLIMNIIGLVNSTLDWRPLKWTNKLEQIWNLSLSQRTHILDTIGEERIKAILSYIVIARILIAHVFTLSYMSNFYPIITWTRPNLLLPWLILSFFKNVVLEVIVIAVGLLLWYDRRFSLPIFLEFVVVKVVPLIFATYNWYSNSCLYMELRRFERIRKLRRSMRSDSNLIASRLYLKLSDSKYKSRSITTLISWESYDAYDTNDMISRIIDDPNLTPAQKAMRILGVTEQDIDMARARVKERLMRRRLTEVEDEDFHTRHSDMKRYFSIVNRYELDMKTLLPPRDELKRSGLERDEVTSVEGSNDTTKYNEATKDEAAENNSTLNNPSTLPKNDQPTGNPGNPENPKIISSESPNGNPSSGKPGSPRNNQGSSPKDIVPGGNLGNPKCNPFRELNSSTETRSSSKKRIGIDSLRAKKSKQMKLCSSCHLSEFKHNSSFSKKRDATGLYSGKNVKKAMGGSCSPDKLRSMLNCNCIVDEYMFAEKIEEGCLSNDVCIRTSTPNGRSERDTALNNVQNDTEYPNDLFKQLCESDRIRLAEKRTLAMSNCPTLVEKLMEQELNVLRNVDKRNDQRLEYNLTADGKIDQKVLPVLSNETKRHTSTVYTKQCIPVADREPDFSEIAKSLNVSADMANNFETLKMIEDRERVMNVQAENEIARTLVSVKCSISSDTSFIERSILTPYVQTTDQNLINMNLPKYSFAETNIPRFYKDSMKVFDGCYEKDFANNSEVQSLLQQLEKKNWSLFHGQTNRDILMPSSVLMQNEQFTVQDLRAGYHLANDFDSIDRYEISVSSSSKANCEQLISSIEKTNERSLDDAPSMLNENRKPVYHTLTKNVYTQTDDGDQTRSSGSSLIESKRRKKPFLKRKRLKDETRSGSPISSFHNRSNTESQSSFWKNNYRVPPRQRSSKPLDNQRKQPQMPKSLSDRSVCECKMPQVDNKHYSHSSEWKFDRKPSSRCKVDSYGTVPLPQAAKPSMFETVVYRRKPPVYPKKHRNEVPTQTSPPATSSKKMSALKKLLEATAKRSTDRQPIGNSKKLKWKGKLESVEVQEARELRALKAYNEVTLLRDKQVLESRKKVSSGRNNSQDSGVSETAKSRAQQRKGNLDRSKKDTPRIVDDDYLDKENLYVDATTETEQYDKLSSKGAKIVNGAGKSGSVSNEKYPCAKLSKVNKVTDQLLDNFDRLHGRQISQNSGKSKQTAETSTRKQYTKYSKPKKLAEDENVSVVSVKRLEGAQNGRELERTQAKEDVRNCSIVSVALCVEERLDNIGSREERDRIVDSVGVQNDYDEAASVLMDGTKVERKDGRLFTTIESTLFQDVISTWSSSTDDQGDELQNTVPEIPNESSQLLSSPKLKEDKKREEIDATKLPTKIPSVPTTRSIEPVKQVEVDSKTIDRKELKLESCRIDTSQFVRKIEVAHMGNYVLLSNPSAPRDAEPQRRTIVDDDTIRMLQHAYSDRSLYFIFDLSREILSVGDVLNSVQFRLDNDEFIFHPNGETMGVAMEDLPLLAHEENRLEQTILATIRQFQNFEGNNEVDNPRDVFIATLGHGGLSIDTNLRTVDEFDDEDDDTDELVENVGINEYELNDMLSTVLGALRCLNVGCLRFDNSFRLTYEILEDSFDDDDYDIEELNEGDESERETQRMIEERLLRFVKEDIFTDIEFPIIVKLSDVITASIDTSIELPEELHIDLADIEPSKVNLFSLDEKEDIEFDTNGRFDGIEELDFQRDLGAHSISAAALSSGQFLNINDRILSEDELNADRVEDTIVDNNYLGEFLTNLNKCTIIFPEVAPWCRQPSSREALNKTYDLLKDIDEENEDDAQHGFEVGTIDNSGHEVVGVEKVAAEGIAKKKKQFIELECEETEGTELSQVGETLENVESEFLEKLQTIQESRTFNLEDEDGDENESAQLSEPMSLRIIFTFWFLVFYFYIRHFYQKIFTFNQIPRSTSSLKPFEIHTVPTSTTALLENSELAETLRDEDGSDSEEYEEEVSNLLKGIIDLEEEEEEVEGQDESVLNEIVSQRENINTPVFKTFSNSFEIENKCLRKIDKEVEKTIMYLSVRVTENVKILPFFASDESVSKRSEIDDRSSIESRNKEGKEEIESGHSKIDSDLESESFTRTQCLITNHSLLDNVSELNKIEKMESFVVLESEERKRFELSLAEEEIEAFRYKEEDDYSQEGETKSFSEMKNNFVYAEIETNETDEAPSEEKVQAVDEKEQLIAFTSSKKYEQNHESNRRKDTLENIETVVPEGSVSSIRNVDETNVSATEQNQSGSSGQIIKTTIQSNDSFDSTYTEISDTSKNTGYMADLTDSSMEDFKTETANEND